MGEPLPIAQELLDRRKALPLSRVDLAARIGVPTSVLGTWERGERNLSLVSAYLWAGSLGMRPVLVDAGHPPVPIECCPLLPEGSDVPPIVQQLRATRRARDISTRVFAERLDVAQSLPVLWENGTRHIPLPRTYQYAAVLGLGLALEKVRGRRPRPRRPRSSAAAKASARPVEGGGTGR